jgi:protein-L-isoaspartate(D-aspartate) O-methyltransferase
MNRPLFNGIVDRRPLARKGMIAALRQQGIVDERVLAAMEKIDRAAFVEPALAYRAYDDIPAPIGFGQTISRPSTVATMTQLAELKGTEKALEIGTGSGYQGMVLSLLVEKLYTIERINDLSNRARKKFNELNVKNIVCLVGDGTTGSAKYAPYDVILVTASGPKIPEPLARQLVEGGRMIVPVKEENGEERIHVVRREGSRFKVTRHDPCAFVPLVGKHGH